MDGSNTNKMWILENSKDIPDNFNSRTFSKILYIQTFDYSTIYSTIPREKILRIRLNEIIHDAFYIKN